VFEARLRALVAAFVADKSRQTLRVGPTSKPQRLLCTEVADDEGLQTRTEFEEITRFSFVLFLKDSDGAAALAEAQAERAADRSAEEAARSVKRARPAELAPPVLPPDALQAVGTGPKRDRRTIEEIQAAKAAGGR
jgi:hypothetical protein